MMLWLETKLGYIFQITNFQYVIIRLQTIVQQDVISVWSKFDQDLLRALTPPFPKVQVLRYDGNEQGDWVSFQLSALGIKQKWTSYISKHQVDPSHCFFVDEGTELPFFLSTWKHTHGIIQTPKGTVIDDFIEFTTPFFWLDYLVYPVLWLQFAYRKPIYRKYFQLK